MSNLHIDEKIASLTICILSAFLFVSLYGIARLQGVSSECSYQITSPIYNWIEFGLIVPDFFVALVLIASPWNVLGMIFTRATSTSMVVLGKLIGAGMLGLLGVNGLTIGSSALTWRRSIIQANLAISVSSCLYIVGMLGFRDILFSSSQFFLLCVELLSVVLRASSLFMLPTHSFLIQSKSHQVSKLSVPLVRAEPKIVKQT